MNNSAAVVNMNDLSDEVVWEDCNLEPITEPLTDEEWLQETFARLGFKCEEVRIQKRIDARSGKHCFRVHVAETDKGSAIGRDGETIDDIRKTLGRMASKSGYRINIEIADARPHFSRRRTPNRNRY